MKSGLACICAGTLVEHASKIESGAKALIGKGLNALPLKPFQLTALSKHVCADLARSGL